MAEEPDRYAQLLELHLEVNPKSWAAMQERGIDEQTPLQLDFEFSAPSEVEVRSLLAHLRAATDYEFKGGARDGKEGRRWIVLGTTTPMTLSLEALNAWVTTMTAYGRDGGPADFDGWGVNTPLAGPAKSPPSTKKILGHVLRRRRGG